MGPAHYLLAAAIQGGAGLGSVGVVLLLLADIRATSALRVTLILFLLITQGYMFRHRKYIFVRTSRGSGWDPLEDDDDPFLVGRQLALLVFPCAASVMLIILAFLVPDLDLAVVASLLLGYLIAKAAQHTLFAHEFKHRDRRR
jgi:hypothetical protein